MTVPYCMIHFGKPMPETFGAIGAGVVLGFMSLKTRSIWLGAMLHVAVAWSMDAAALWRDCGMMLALTLGLALFAYGINSRPVITRFEGVVMLLAWIGYNTLLVQQA